MDAAASALVQVTELVRRDVRLYPTADFGLIVEADGGLVGLTR